MKIAFIFHTERNLGDHGAECREVVLFDPDDRISDLLAFIGQRGGALELVRQVEPVTVKDEERSGMATPGTIWSAECFQ